MDEITAKEYREEVNALATECVRQAREEERELDEVIAENVDGHQWVIYTAYHHQVLRHADTDPGERFEDMGGADFKQGWDHVVMQAAYLALEGDVADRARGLWEELPGATE